jgi:hypothetical protein
MTCMSPIAPADEGMGRQSSVVRPALSLPNPRANSLGGNAEAQVGFGDQRLLLVDRVRGCERHGNNAMFMFVGHRRARTDRADR